MNTDSNGEITKDLSVNELHLIDTGLEAIAFTPISETGGSLGARSPVRILAERLIQAEPSVCRVLVGGTPNLYFTSVNKADHALEVPLSYTELNALYSPSGQAIPPSAFAPGTSGFAIPESYFMGALGLEGYWHFIGAFIQVPTVAPICADTGVPGECRVIPGTTFEGPFNFTLKTYFKLVKRANTAAVSGTWQAANGAIARRIQARGARTLALMRSVSPTDTSPRFTCDVSPKNCATFRINKQALIKAFKTMHTVALPRGLQSITKDYAADAKRFKRIVEALPDEYITCPN